MNKVKITVSCLLMGFAFSNLSAQEKTMSNDRLCCKDNPVSTEISGNDSNLSYAKYATQTVDQIGLEGERIIKRSEGSELETYEEEKGTIDR